MPGGLEAAASGGMHALVTGASGFLGGRLVEMLLATGVEVSVLLRPSSRLGAPLNGQPRLDVLRVELDPALGSSADAMLLTSLQAITHVFHCAGCSTDWAPLRVYEEGNIGSTVAMLGLAIVHMPQLQRFVHVSTTDVYGYPVVAVDETAEPVDTGLPYNSSKLRGERLVWQAAKGGLPVTVVRPASIYGPGGRAFVTDIVALLRQRLMLLVDAGRAPGGFVYVDDVCRAMMLAAVEPQALGQVYNLSSVDGTTWSEYASALARAFGLPPPWLKLPFGAAMKVAAASELPHRSGLPGQPLLTRHAVYLLGRDQQYPSSRAQRELGWAPSVGLVEGLRLCAAAARV